MHLPRPTVSPAAVRAVIPATGVFAVVGELPSGVDAVVGADVLRNIVRRVRFASE